MTAESELRSGYVALLGKPNAGKSTLLNCLLGQKIAAVSAKPQTTRKRILGILNLPQAQVLFLDTPGILGRTDKRLTAYMQREAWSVIKDADLAVLLVDCLKPDRRRDEQIADRLHEAKIACICTLNKIDKIDRLELLPMIEHYSGLPGVSQVIPISALSGDGVDDLLLEIVNALPPGPAYYPRDQLSDQTERLLAAEIVREKVFKLMRQEIPYSTAVDVIDYREPGSSDAPVEIEAEIWVERDSQKGMVIGAAGRTIKLIGTQAREELEQLLGRKVVLRLFVKLKRDWTRDPQALAELGYKPD
ncbi:MAG: GTPase Era [Candidatus Alcyoniella australis]|nr:GTPase Era [Candidatus Alcyoniella australis]